MSSQMEPNEIVHFFGLFISPFIIRIELEPETGCTGTWGGY